MRDRLLAKIEEFPKVTRLPKSGKFSKNKQVWLREDFLQKKVAELFADRNGVVQENVGVRELSFLGKEVIE